jgi:hypothetical protein
LLRFARKRFARKRFAPSERTIPEGFGTRIIFLQQAGARVGILTYISKAAIVLCSLPKQRLCSVR